MTTDKKEVKAPVVVTMSNGKEITFGRRKALMNVKHDDEGIHLHIAHSDGEYRTHSIPHEDAAEWAAYGLRAFAKDQNLESSKDFDEKVLNWSHPLATVSVSTSGAAPTPIELALVQATGKTHEQVKAFIAAKSRKEVNALKAHPSIAPIYAAHQAAALAKVAAAKAKKAGTEESQADLLAGLVDETDPE